MSTPDDDQFEQLIAGVKFRDETADDRITIPRWVGFVFCATIPGFVFLPSAAATGNSSSIIVGIIVTVLLGAALYYYFTHYNLLRSFLKQEKPYKQVLAEHRESQQMLNKLSAETSPDSRIEGRHTLTSQEDADWENIIKNLDNPDKK